METRSSKRLHPYKSKQVKSREKIQASLSNTSSKGESAGQSVVSPNTQLNLCGHNETQVSEGGEADLHKHFVNCKKNPGHTKFMSVKNFTLRDLPRGFHDPDLYELIKVTADLTVRLGVKMTSPHRPEFHPDTNDPYPFYNMRNKPTLRLGTGEITVYKYIDGCKIALDGNQYLITSDASKKTCPCTKCQHSDRPKNVWWKILVHTSAHVVCDDIEASHTSCRLFYDGEDSPVVSLDTASVQYLNIERDWCGLKYVTCDSLGDKLYKMALRWWDLWEKVWIKYMNKFDVKLTFIVSHPHGCPKQVSVGQLVDNSMVCEYDKESDETKLTYTTSTCPGSSGARVHCVGSDNFHFHHGVLTSELNYSCVGLYRKEFHCM